MEDPSAWLRRCHDRVRDGTGWSPTDALDALLGLLIGAHEGPEPAAVKRARDQALDAVSRDAGATASLRRALPEAVEAAVLDAALAATPADVSRAVMAFLDADARRLTGAFHTPSTLAEALVACAEPADSDVIVDPACGTGAFLAAASRRAPRARLVGVERDPRAAVLCRLALADHAGPVHVRVGDGVALLPGLRPTLVLANPPFGLRDADGAISELAFLEAALQALPRGGRAWFVLPRSVLTNVRLAAYRDRLDRLGALRTAIDLPPQTFVHTGARLVTTAIELVRGAPPGPAAHLRPRHVGWDSRGQPAPDDDLPELARRRRAALDLAPAPDDRALDRPAVADVHRALPGPLRSAVPLGDLCADVRAGRTPPRSALGDVGHFMIKVGNLTGRAPSFTPRPPNHVLPERMPRLRAGPTDVLPDDVLLTGTAHSPRYIARKVDLVVGLPPHLVDPVLCSGEVVRIRARPEHLDPVRLWCWLRSPEGYAALQARVRGQTAHLYPSDLVEVPIDGGALHANFPDALIAEVRDALACCFNLEERWRILQRRLAGTPNDRAPEGDR